MKIYVVTNICPLAEHFLTKNKQNLYMYIHRICLINFKFFFYSTYEKNS